MEVITITTEAFQKIINMLSEMSEKIDQSNNKHPLSDKWLDISDVCQLLKISKRTLQKYRTDRVLNFSQINGRIYFKASDIQSLLERHYIKNTNKQ